MFPGGAHPGAASRAFGASELRMPGRQPGRLTRLHDTPSDGLPSGTTENSCVWNPQLVHGRASRGIEKAMGLVSPPSKSSICISSGRKTDVSYWVGLSGCSTVCPAPVLSVKMNERQLDILPILKEFVLC